MTRDRSLKTIPTPSPSWRSAATKHKKNTGFRYGTANTTVVGRHRTRPTVGGFVGHRAARGAEGRRGIPVLKKTDRSRS